jgi:alpha-L-rhamnosidase
MGEYVTPNGRMISGTQTSYVLALNFDMLPENLRESAAKRLVNNIDDYDDHITTGFLGTPYICHVLSRFGHIDMAYDYMGTMGWHKTRQEF